MKPQMKKQNTIVQTKFKNVEENYEVDKQM